MKEQENKYITVAYKLYTTDSEGKESMMEEATAAHPFQFISGMGITLDAFEEAVANLAKGEKFNFVIPIEKAYGARDESAVLDLPKNIFEIDGKFDSERIFPGNVVPLMNADGNRLNATVIEVKADSVLMDFNHPLAGKELHFVGEVTESRPATNEEIQELVNALSGDSCCGGNCGGCGGGCGEGDGSCGDGSCGCH